MSSDAALDLQQREQLLSGEEALFMLGRLQGIGASLRTLVSVVVARTMFGGVADINVSLDAWIEDLPPLPLYLGVERRQAVVTLEHALTTYKLLREVCRIASTDDGAAYTVHRLALNPVWSTWAWQPGFDRHAARVDLMRLFRVTSDDGPLVQGVARNLALYVERVGEVRVNDTHPAWGRWLRNAAELVRKGATPAIVRDLLWRYVHANDSWRLRLAEDDADEVLLAVYEVLVHDRRFRRPVPDIKKLIGPKRRRPRGVDYTPPRRRR